MHAYTSWVLRYVPDPVTGEFINIGVIVGRDNGDWAVRSVQSFRRANWLGGNAAPLKHWIGRLSAQAEITSGRTIPSYSGFQEFATGRPLSTSGVFEMAARNNNALQFSAPRPAFAPSAQEGADMLFAHVVRDTPHTGNRRARTVLLEDFENALTHAWHGNKVPVLRRPLVSVGRQMQRFDFAVHDDQVEQLTQVININRKVTADTHQEIQAWNFMVTRIRERGAFVPSVGGKSDGRVLQIARDVNIAVVHDEPRTDEHREVLSIARDAWQQIGVQSVEPDDIEDVATQAFLLVG